jgi:hypothetical protein
MTANAITRSSLTPARGVAVSASNPAIWYPMHEGTGTTLADALGSGPTLTVGGTSPAATIWANAGCLTPNGTDHAATAAQQAHADTVCNLNSLVSGGMLILGMEIQYAGANSASNYIFGHGRDAATAGYGGWWFGVNGSDQPQFLFRGNGAASNVSGAMGLNVGDTHSGMVRMLLALWIENRVSLRAELRTGTTGDTVGTAQYDLTGQTIPSAALDGLTVGGKRISGATLNSYSAARLDNLFVQKRAAYSSTIAAAAWADMAAAPREFPRSLRG